MEDFIQFSAKTKNEAITKACIELGTSSDQLEIQVISEGSSGFFGIGSKPAIIKVRKIETVSEEDEIKEIVGSVKMESIIEEKKKENIQRKQELEKKYNKLIEEEKEIKLKISKMKEESQLEYDIFSPRSFRRMERTQIYDLEETLKNVILNKQELKRQIREKDKMQQKLEKMEEEMEA